MEKPHLRLTFSDGDIAFVPLVAQDVSEPGVRARLFASVDMHKPSGLEVIQHHLAPFLSGAALPSLAASRIVARGPTERLQAIVAPLTSPLLPRATIANLLREPLTEQEQILLVCGPEWASAALDGLVEWLQFYEVPATVLSRPDAVTPLDAVLAASMHAQAETFMIISPTAASSCVGARQALWTAGIGADAVCPTVLYEDGSIRFAGSSTLQFSERAPFARVESRWMGLSAQSIQQADPVDAVGGTLECCVLTRAALAAAERARRHATKFAQEAALFSELEASGARVVWHPTVSIATADEYDQGVSTNAPALVDHWSLRAKWGETKCAS